MIILTIRTDNPEAEIGLYQDKVKIDYHVWTAHRQLSETIHQQIEKLLQNHSHTIGDIEGIVCYKGPGSFTGLRIGLTVANALAYSLDASIVATMGENWLEEGLDMLGQGKDQKVVVPEYGRDPHITKQKK